MCPMLTHLLLETPDLELVLPFWGVDTVHYRPDVLPALLLVEARGAVVPDRAREPGGLDALCSEVSFGVGDQRPGDAGATRLAGDEQLIELVVLGEVEPDRCSWRTDDADVRQRLPQPLPEAFPGAQALEVLGEERRVGVLPRVVPHGGELIDLVVSGRPDHDWGVLGALVSRRIHGVLMTVAAPLRKACGMPRRAPAHVLVCAGPWPGGRYGNFHDGQTWAAQCRANRPGVSVLPCCNARRRRHLCSALRCEPPQPDSAPRVLAGRNPRATQRLATC